MGIKIRQTESQVMGIRETIGKRRKVTNEAGQNVSEEWMRSGCGLLLWTLVRLLEEVWIMMQRTNLKSYHWDLECSLCIIIQKLNSVK